MHTTFAVSTDGLPLGILDQKIFPRRKLSKKMRELKKRSHNTALPIEKKESFMWIEALNNSKKQLENCNTKVVTVCDREADIYDLFNQVKQNDIPLNGKDDTVRVNYFSYEMLVPDDEGNEKINYKNSWVSDFVVDKKNVAELVKIGRARWKIENECFNTLKNQGYFINHNYGHGAKNLSFNFLILTELAFFMHQIAELTDSLFKECRAKLGSKHALWEFVRSSIKIFVFESWEFLFSFILNPKAFNPTIIRISD